MVVVLNGICGQRQIEKSQRLNVTRVHPLLMLQADVRHTASWHNAPISYAASSRSCEEEPRGDSPAPNCMDLGVLWSHPSDYCTLLSAGELWRARFQTSAPALSISCRSLPWLLCCSLEGERGVGNCRPACCPCPSRDFRMERWQCAEGRDGCVHRSAGTILC